MDLVNVIMISTNQQREIQAGRELGAVLASEKTGAELTEWIAQSGWIARSNAREWKNRSVLSSLNGKPETCLRIQTSERSFRVGGVERGRKDRGRQGKKGRAPGQYRSTETARRGRRRRECERWERGRLGGRQEEALT